MGARSSNTDRNGHRNNSENVRLDGHLSYFYNSSLNSGGVSPNAGGGVPFSATGGTKDTSSRSGYTLHKFTDTGNGTFVLDGVPSAPFTTVECLIVAGGGAGGCHTGAGGGGGGGVLYWNALPISNGTIPVSVGAGGEGGSPSTTTQGLQGGDSVVVANPGATTYTASGGGGGCGGIQASVPPANAGGSSGGASAPGGPTGLNPNPAKSATQSPVGSFTGYGNDGGRGYHTGGAKIDGGGGGGDGGDNWTGQPGPDGGQGIIIFAYPGTY